MDVLLSGLALALIIEGLMPFLAPQRWRAAVRQASELADGQLRFVGLALILVGVVLLLSLG